ncbi:hypothetical protein F8E02_10030 [Methanoculleus sp. Wushi-C6]|uniref:Two component regulator with propeller domain n=1 Tax=Methanoculleus caldifontis TaxID=2651577 RepID=A0ABU3X4I5_9EURY|nr:hypothetical protein [Methanoculleus sp. Wushi-C6]
MPDYYSGIASAGVTDAINGRHGDVIFATDYGISVYTANGTWYSVNPRHPGETAYGTLEPLDTMVTAVALDHEGHLWIGYPGGLQIGDGKGYRAIQDLDLLKNRNINCMVRWGDEIWIATGRAGLHRYSEGAWTWYKPLGAEGLACYTVASMAVDAASDTLVIVSELDGVQVVSNGAGAIRFEPVISGGEPVRGIAGVRADPFGGVYLFNRTAVLHYTPGGEVVPVLDVGDLSAFPVAINDLAATPEGMLLVATDSGIYGWYLSDVVVHITSRDGLRSNFVKKLFVDADGRCWFVVPGNVGYIPPITEPATLTLSAVPVEVPDLPATPAPPTPAPDATPEEPAGMLESIRASLAAWVGSVSARVAGA